MSIAGEITRIRGNIASAYSACEEKGADMPSAQTSSLLAETISGIPQSPGVKLVFLYDYDGTLLYSFTETEINRLSALPPQPVHEGLTGDGWNWTLAQIQTYINAYQSRVNVASLYHTSDNKTRIYIQLEDGETSFGLKLIQSGPNVTAIDWGDGSQIQTFGTAGSTLNGRTIYQGSHSYSPASYPACYVVTLSLIGDNPNSWYGFGAYMWSSVNISPTQNAVRRIELASNVSLDEYAFGNQNKLESIAWNGVTNEGYLFYYCKSLKFAYSADYAKRGMFLCCEALEYASLPYSCVGLGNSVFNACKSLKSAGALPQCTVVGDGAFCGCYSLTDVVLPQCASIGAEAFNKCRSLSEISMPLCESIGDNAFLECSSLKKTGDVSLCSSVGASAFKGCYLLDKVIFGTAVANSAYYDSYVRTRIVIPATVRSIAQNAFLYQYSLNEVDLTAFTDPNSLPTLGAGFNSVFTSEYSNGNQRKVVFYVASEAMKTAFSSATNWSAGAAYYKVA